MSLTLNLDFLTEPNKSGFSNVHGLEGARHGWTNWFDGFEQVLEHNQ